MKQYPATLFYYGVGGVTLGIVGNAVTYFMLIYYNQILGFPAYLVSIALAVALVFDAISDPLVGMLSDRTNTRIGRRHPYLYFTLIPLPILYFLLWNPPDWIQTSDLAGFSYLVVLLIAFRTVMTCYDIPSNAMVPELTRDYDQRTSMMSARISAAWVAGVSFTVLMYAVFLQPTAAHPDGALNQQGYQQASYVGAVLIFLSILISSLGTHRHVPTLKKSREGRSLSLKTALATMGEIFTNRPFRAVMAFAIVLRSSDGLIAALWIYLATYFWLLDTDQIAFLTLMNLLGALGAMFALPRMARLTDKRNIALVANSIALFTACLPIGLRVSGLIPDTWVWPMLVIVSIFDTFFFVILLSIMASMFADVVEDVQTAGGLRHEGAVISAQTFVSKLSTAVGTWLAGMVLTLVAFPDAVGVADVSEVTRQELALTYLSILLVSISLGAFFLLRFTLDRVKHHQNLTSLGETVV